MIKTIRAGEAPIVIKCGLAATPPKVAVDTAGPEAALGSAVHDSIEAWIDDQMLGEPDPQPHANKHGVDADQVAALAHAAPGLLDKINEDLSNAQAEIVVTGELIRGRVDLLAVNGGEQGQPVSASVIDWKTGRDPLAGSKPEQRLAYASAVESTYGMPAQGYVYTAEVWLATGDLIESRFDADTIEGFRDRLADKLQRPIATPGPHCRYCRRIHECKGRDAYLRSAATALSQVPQGTLTPEAIAALWDPSRALRAALDAYDKAVDALVDLTGELPLPDGRRVVHAQVSRDSIDARKAWATLEAHGLGPSEINKVLSVSKTRLLSAIANRAPRGKKATAKADLMTALDLVGAITRTTSKRKKVEKKNG